MMKKMLSLALTLAMVASITACGSKPETTTTAAETTKAGETAKAGDGAAADVQKIIDRGTLKVGCKSDIPKFSLQNTATGEYEGFEDDIAYEIAGKIFGCTADEAKEKKLVAFQGVTAKTRGPLLENGEIDLVIATFTITDERKETYNFSTPYYTDAVGLLVNKDSGITSIEGLDGKVVGIAQSANTKEMTLKYIDEKGLKVKPQFQEFDGYPALAQALATKQIDCFSVDRAILSGYVNDKNHILEDRFAEQDYGVASAKENTGLAALVEEKVTSMISDGSMKKLQDKWELQ
ncbi:transporter substrate-binding domain-containing protein [Lacrimispora xylanolytica]|uniref:Transporter substrate-binding domain-containing protein n=1 Tax=Lacrimispora xylanolytica TaxID=29375 RepID=A0ABY7ACB0_9FIRM|nr:transporter substrate-binding domain-containing protein [Lacrimispora xylanolytica]WAJ24320.1 transporter substrate-binding domain-containing protein [Lacrimispora xylanolytica]